VNRLYLRLVYDFWRRTLPRLGLSLKGARVLECGTGPRNLLRLLTDWFPEVRLFGLDIDFQAVVQARRNGGKSHLLAASAEKLPFPDETFDLVISLHMVEHLGRPEDFVREAFRVLQPGGVLALATPNPTGIGARLMGKCWGG